MVLLGSIARVLLGGYYGVVLGACLVVTMVLLGFVMLSLGGC